MNPHVSFVVPCYRLAHLLPQCIESILAQTYSNFEILVMDDCSPDNTAEVVSSFRDSRIRYIRNETNLKHLRNYNKGITLSKGEYIWLISADDCLRRPYVLQRYVELMDAHPNVGYAFCSAVGLLNGQETGVLDYSIHGDRNAIFDGHRFLEKLVHANTIVAASGLVRKECYEKAGLFPIDMPWGGDWYLWCAFAFHSDVAYFAEPMVCYRRHEMSMTNTLMEDDIGACYSDDIKIPWILKAIACRTPGCRRVARECLRSIANEYAHRISGKQYKQARRRIGMPLSEFEASLNASPAAPPERKWLRARVYSRLGDLEYGQGQFRKAREWYSRCLGSDPLMPKVWAKWLLMSCGRAGAGLRNRLARDPL